MTMLLGAAGIAIDLGHVMNVRTESQRVADLSALAGAAAFINAPGPNVAQTAETWAIGFAAQNTVNRLTVTLIPSDVTVDLNTSRVDVTVSNTAARGNAIPTVFARVLGFPRVDVVTTAAAAIFPAAGVQCVLPLFVVDNWDELGGDPLRFDPGIDYYEAYDVTAPTSTYTGYDQGDIGSSILFKPAQGPAGQSGRPNASWYYPFDAANIPGGANYRAAIQGCTAPDFIYTIGMQLWVEAGAMIGPTKQGFNDLIQQDPDAAWDPGLDCVVDSGNLGSGNSSHCRSSPRLRPAPLFDPSTAPANGKKLVTVENFVGVFVDRVVGNNVWVILAGYSGVGPIGGPATGVTPPLLNVVRLIR